MGKLRIIVDNNKSRLLGDAELIHKLRETYKIKKPGYFFSPAYRKRVWDGYQRYITEGGLVSTGLLPELLPLMEKLKIGVSIEDRRIPIKISNLKETLKGEDLFAHQVESRNALFNNTLLGIPFMRGILNDATNAGKSYVLGSILNSLSNKHSCIIIINLTEIYEQLVVDLTKWFGKDVGQICAGEFKVGRYTICMAQTLYARINKDMRIRETLANADCVIVDEADLAISKTYKTILGFCLNAPIRVGLTGTAFLSKLKKDEWKNRELKSFFGDELHSIRNNELVDKGFSTKPIIRIHTGNTTAKERGDFVLEKEKGIIKNKERNKKVWGICQKHNSKGRIPILILIQYHQHIKYLLKVLPEELGDLTIQSVHHKTANRRQIFEDFNKGRIDILISSMIIKRGKNLPLIKALVNAAGGDSHSTILQILGRALRKHKSKKKVYMDDFYDMGSYLQRHSRHRIRYYKAENFPVKELYKSKS